MNRIKLVALLPVFVLALSHCANEQPSAEGDAEAEATGTVAASALSGDSQTALVIDVGGSAEVALAVYAGESAPADLHVDYVDGLMVARAELSPSLLEASVLLRLKSRVYVHDASGEICEGSLGAIHVIARAFPHDDVDGSAAEAAPVANDGDGTGENNGESELPVVARKVAEVVQDAHEIAKQVWAHAATDHRITAKLTVAAGHCEAPVFVHFGAANEGLFALDSDTIMPTIAERAHQQFTQLPEYRDNQVSYDEFRAGLPPEAKAEYPAEWETVTPDSINARTFRSSRGETLVWIAASNGGGCAAFSANLGALYKVRGNELDLVRVFQGIGQTELAAVIERDVASDNVVPAKELQLIFPIHTVNSKSDSSYDDVSVSVLYEGCGC